MRETGVEETRLFALGQPVVLSVNDSVAPNVVELGEDEEDDIEDTETDQSLVCGIVY